MEEETTKYLSTNLEHVTDHSLHLIIMQSDEI